MQPHAAALHGCADCLFVYQTWSVCVSTLSGCLVFFDEKFIACDPALTVAN